MQVFDETGERFFLPLAVPVAEGTGADKQILGVTLVLADVTNLRRLDLTDNILVALPVTHIPTLQLSAALNFGSSE